MINAIPVPAKGLGTSANLNSSRIPAISMSAIVKPMPAPNPKISDWIKEYAPCTAIREKPNTAQLVVMRGR